MTQAYETVHNQMVTMHKELEQQKTLFEIFKKCLKNKKFVLQDKFVFTMGEMLE